MATGHILPGYGEPVTRLQRAKSAFPMDKTKLKEFAQLNVPKPARQDLDRIRENARYIWSRLDREPTTYNFQYPEKSAEYMPCRPASPSRRNKPHPPLVFLTNRLHYIPGYHNADTTIGKDVYRVDGVVPYEEQLQRQQLRDKYIGRVSSAVNPYKDTYGFRDQLEPNEAQAAEAWTKIADDKDHHQVFQSVEKYNAEREAREATAPQRTSGSFDNTPRPLTAMPSLHRWMKFAGKRETSALQNHLRAIHTNPNKMSYDQLVMAYNQMSGTTDARRQTDIDNIKRTRYVHRPARGEYSMHPEWPPTMPHHYVP